MSEEAARPSSDSLPTATSPAGQAVRHGGALLADLLIQHGVEFVFGLPGGQTLALYDGISEREPTIRHVLVRDERSAAYAADAYARVTGKVGVCDATVGPGTAKLPSGLGEALGASIPVVALVSELPARVALHKYRSAASQAMDQATLLSSVTKWQETVPDLASLPGLVRQAFRQATTGRPGPVALFLPQDVLDSVIPEGDDADALLIAGRQPDPLARRFGGYPAFRPVPQASDVAEAAAVLRRAARPFLLVGGGAIASGAGAAVTALAQRISAAMATTLSGKGCVAEDDTLAVGVAGTMGSSGAATAFAEADAVVLVGSKGGSGATFSWTLPRVDQAVVQIDIDPAELGRAFPLEAALLADCRTGVQALVECLGASGGDEPDRRPWVSRLTELNESWRAQRRAEGEGSDTPIRPQRLVSELEAVLGADDVVVCDASLSSGWGGVYLEQPTPGRRILSPRGLAGLGFALPAAIGVATAHRDRRTVVLTGDGALGYAVGEMATVMEQRLPITVVVLNNRSLGWIRWYRRITFGRDWQDDDFADVAYHRVGEAFGWSGSRVVEPGDLRPALEAALHSTKPSIVDVVTDAWQTPVAAHRRAVADATHAAGYGG
jgi:acetolactate synthase-1/2/3 large subunit